MQFFSCEATLWAAHVCLSFCLSVFLSVSIFWKNWMFQGCTKTSSGVNQGWLKGVLRVSQGCILETWLGRQLPRGQLPQYTTHHNSGILSRIQMKWNKLVNSASTTQHSNSNKASSDLGDNCPCDNCPRGQLHCILSFVMFSMVRRVFKHSFNRASRVCER